MLDLNILWTAPWVWSAMAQPENRQQNVSMSFVGSLGVGSRWDPVWSPSRISGVAGVIHSSKAVVENFWCRRDLGAERAPAFIPPADQGNFQKLCWLISKELGGSAPFSLQHPKATSEVTFASLGVNRKELSLSWDKSFVVQLQVK